MNNGYDDDDDDFNDPNDEMGIEDEGPDELDFQDEPDDD
jgi:hypothetical protein